MNAAQRIEFPEEIEADFMKEVELEKEKEEVCHQLDLLLEELDFQEKEIKEMKKKKMKKLEKEMEKMNLMKKKRRREEEDYEEEDEKEGEAA